MDFVLGGKEGKGNEKVWYLQKRKIDENAFALNGEFQKDKIGHEVFVDRF